MGSLTIACWDALVVILRVFDSADTSACARMEVLVIATVALLWMAARCGRLRTPRFGCGLSILEARVAEPNC